MTRTCCGWGQSSLYWGGGQLRARVCIRYFVFVLALWPLRSVWRAAGCFCYAMARVFRFLFAVLFGVLCPVCACVRMRVLFACVGDKYILHRWTCITTLFLSLNRRETASGRTSCQHCVVCNVGPWSFAAACVQRSAQYSLQCSLMLDAATRGNTRLLGFACSASAVFVNVKIALHFTLWHTFLAPIAFRLRPAWNPCCLAFLSLSNCLVSNMICPYAVVSWLRTVPFGNRFCLLALHFACRVPRFDGVLQVQLWHTFSYGLGTYAVELSCDTCTLVRAKHCPRMAWFSDAWSFLALQSSLLT